MPGKTRASGQAADPGDKRTPLCAYHWLVRLARAWSLLPRAPAGDRQDAHCETGPLVSKHAAAQRDEHRCKSTHRLTLRAQPSRRITEGLERLHNLIRWLGGLQGRRTAVRDAEGNSALKELHQKETGYSGKTLISFGTKLRGGRCGVTLEYYHGAARILEEVRTGMRTQ